jgi:hypothetical protein
MSDNTEKPLMGVASVGGKVIHDFTAEALGTKPIESPDEIVDIDSLPDFSEDEAGAQDADQPRAASGEWTSGGGGVGGEDGAHNAKHLSSLPKDMQDYHRAMQAPIAKHGYVELGTAGSDDPVRDHLVHKMYKSREKGNE